MSEETKPAETPKSDPDGVKPEDAPPPSPGEPSGSDSEAPATPEGEEAPAEEPKAAEFAAIAKAQKRLRKEQEKIKQARAQESARLSAMERQLNERMAQANAVLEKASLLQTEPERALELLGIDKETYFRRLMNEGREGPEDRIARLEQMLQQREEADRAAREEAQRQHVMAQRAEAVNNFASYIAEHPEEFPYTNRIYTTEEIAKFTWNLARDYEQRRVRLDDDEIASQIEAFAKKRFHHWNERHQKLGALADREPEAEGSTKTANGHQTRPGTRTLTNKGSAERASIPREMTEEEKDAWAIEELKRASALDRKSRKAG